MNLTVKNKFYLNIVLLVLILGGMAFGAWYSFGLVNQESQNLTNYKKELSQIENKRAKVLEASDSYANLKASILKLDDAILQNDNELKFIVLAEDLANKYGLNEEIKISQTGQPKKGKQQEPEDAVYFQLELSGSFAGVLSFIEEIQNAKYFSDIQNVSLQRVSAAIGVQGGKNEFPVYQGDVKASITIRVPTY